MGGDPINFVDPSGYCFWSTFKREFGYDWDTTNDFFFEGWTSLSFRGMRMAASGATATTVGTVTAWQAIKSLPTGGVATLGGIPGTIGSAAFNWGVAYAATYGSLKAGIAVGSGLDALIKGLADDKPCGCSGE